MNFHSHRARAIAAKNISSKSSVHISEILGVAPIASTSSQDPLGETPERELTSTNDAEGLEISKITTSTKSLADYFNEKLNARSRVFKPTDSATPSSSSNDTGDKDSYDAPRMGLGSTHLRIEVHSEARVEEEAQRVGLSKFSSLSSSSFLAATSSLSSYMTLLTEKEEKVDGARIIEAQCKPIDVEDGTKKPVEVKRKKSSKRSNGLQTDNSDYQMERSKKDRRGKEKVGKTKKKGSGVTNEEEEERRKEERRKQKKMRRKLKESQLAAIVKDQGVDHREKKGKKVS
jgi:Pin2-interacting protein X1